MSANNWTVCPQCQARRVKERTDRAHVAQAAYGKVSAEEYQRLLDNIAGMLSYEDKDSMREDYQLGISDGKFSVSYHCSCSKCDFEWSFEHRETLKPKVGK